MDSGKRSNLGRETEALCSIQAGAMEILTGIEATNLQNPDELTIQRLARHCNWRKENQEDKPNDQPLAGAYIGKY